MLSPAGQQQIVDFIRQAQQERGANWLPEIQAEFPTFSWIAELICTNTADESFAELQTEFPNRAHPFHTTYDAAGKLIEEYSESTLQTAYVYAGSRLLTTETPTGTSYLTSDHLGSPRINTDQSGAVTARHDYMPFGEEIFAVGGRIVGLSYTTDTVRKQFTGYERDSESELDYAQARYYNNLNGRFTTTDSVGPDLANPQTLRSYQYCLNNPLRYIDKNGKYEEDVHRDLTIVLAYAAGFSMRQATAIGNENQYIDDGPTNPVGYGPKAYGARSKHHFTTEQQRNSLWGEFENAAANQNETNQLMRLGTYLHAQQDSFSHDGYGALFGQATDLFNDGIVPSYEAASKVDKTDTDPAKAERMAEDSFKRLISARNIMAGSGKSVSFYRPISYGAIRPLVARWVRESDPQKKAAILAVIRRKIQNGRDVQDFPKNVTSGPKKIRQRE